MAGQTNSFAAIQRQIEREIERERMERQLEAGRQRMCVYESVNTGVTKIRNRIEEEKMEKTAEKSGRNE